MSLRYYEANFSAYDHSTEQSNLTSVHVWTAFSRASDATAVYFISIEMKAVFE